MKTWILALMLLVANTANAKTVVPEVFKLGRSLCVATARAQLLDACDFHAEVKARKSNAYGMALELCGTYGEDNPAREAFCFTRAAKLIEDEDTREQASRCQDLSTPGEKSSCLKKLFVVKNGEKKEIAQN